MEHRTSEKSLSDLVSDLTREASVLIRDEVRLAKTEISEKVDQATSGAVSLLSGALIAFAGLIILLNAIAILLADLIAPWTLQPWVAPMIIGIAVPLIGLLMMQRGRKRISAEGLAPHRTMHSINRDKDMIKG